MNEVVWLDPSAFDDENGPIDQPYRAVDLASWPPDRHLPSWRGVPVLGVGAFDHPVARQCDVVIEEPFKLGAIVDAIAAMPRPAAVLCQLVRATERVGIPDAIAMESLAYAALQGGKDHALWRQCRRPACSDTLPGKIRVVRDGDCLSITLDRPEARNAIDRVMRDGLKEAFELASLDRSINKVEFGATGRFFSTGADLGEFGTMTDPIEAHFIRMHTLPAIWMARRAEIVRVNITGGAVGAGLELAAFAGRVTCSPTAWFQLPELTMGILPGAGGCVSIPRRIGRQRFALMVLSGRRIDAKTALRWGLVDAIC